jgi:hypothetical protein
VVAKALDGSLKDATKAITVTAAPDTTAPALQSVTPSEGDVELAYGANFILTVDASDENLYELEIDHSLEGTVPEFSVYAAEGDGAYGTAGDKADFEAAGASVSYDEDEQKWEINMGPAVTDAILLNHGITFYIVLKDASGNQWGTMYGTTPENTFVYNVTRAEVNAITLTPVPASGSGSAVQGGILSGSTVTLSSNYSASGLTTVVSLSKDGEAVDFDTVFSSYALSTQVGDGAVAGAV